ncbi:MAG: hypothetical protein ACXVNO_02990 [Bacteroidia bacterium]
MKKRVSNKIRIFDLIKIILLLFPVSAGLTSCKKDYTCECTSAPGSSSQPKSEFAIHDTKRQAEKRCREQVGADLLEPCKLK